MSSPPFLFLSLPSESNRGTIRAIISRKPSECVCQPLASVHVQLPLFGSGSDPLIPCYLDRLALYLLPSNMIRKNVAHVQQLDPLGSAWNVSVKPLAADDGSIMLAIINVASDPSVLLAEKTDCLARVLTEVAGALHERGSLAIPMESVVSFNTTHIEGMTDGEESTQQVESRNDLAVLVRNTA